MIAADARMSASRPHASNPAATGTNRSRPEPVKTAGLAEAPAFSAEDAAAIESRSAAFLADYRPATEAGKGLVRRAAMLSIRLERCFVRETAAIARNVRAAGDAHDEAREEDVDALFEMLREDPEKACRRLLRMPEGIDRMLDNWAGMFEDLKHESGDRWTDEHGILAVNLTGRRVGGIGIARVEALALAALGDFSLLTREDGEGLDDPARRDWARSDLASLILAEARKLQIRRESLDLKAIEADRAGAADRALFDPSKEATLARRYEAAAERSLRRAIQEMRAIEAEAASRPASPPSQANGTTSVPSAGTSLGSFSSSTTARAGLPSGPTSVPRTGSETATSRESTAVGRAEIARN